MDGTARELAGSSTGTPKAYEIKPDHTKSGATITEEQTPEDARGQGEWRKQSSGLPWPRGTGLLGGTVRTWAEPTPCLYLRRGRLVPGGRGSQVSLAIPEEREEKTPPDQFEQNQARGPGHELCLPYELRRGV